ncbi:hypothetical protein [Kitasatospora sp. NPDC093679]|uniref:hypothetical protein n=1 Tax=Kitasatospora sp. NPDC093679 TaxID=3154983 RepID=UPI003439306B
MDVVMALGSFCLPALAAWDVLRIAGSVSRSEVPRFGSSVSLGIWSGGTLYVGSHGGPAFLVPVACVLLGAAALLLVVVPVVRALRTRASGRAMRTGTAVRLFRRIIATTYTASGSVMLGVTADGGVILPDKPPLEDGAPPRVRLTEGCPYCLVEDVLAHLLELDAAPFIRAYRHHVASGENRVFVVGRVDGTPGWTTGMAALAGHEVAPAVPCRHHRSAAAPD